jgi:hypothetical protein
MRLIDGHGDDLLVHALLVLHEQRADRPRADDRPVATGVGVITMQSSGSPSSDSV